MKDYIIAIGVLILFLGAWGVANWLTYGGFTAAVLVALLSYFLYVFVNDYEKTGSKERLIAIAGGIVIVTIEVFLRAFRQIGYDVKGSGMQFFALIIILLIYNYTGEKPTGQPNQTPTKFTTALKFWAILGGLGLFVWILGKLGFSPIYGYLTLILGAVIYNLLTEKTPPNQPPTP